MDVDDEQTASTASTAFRQPKKKVQLRKKLDEDGEEEEEGPLKLDDVKELQRSRERRNGINSLEAAVGKERAAQMSAGGDSTGGGLVLTGQQRAKLEAAGIEAGIREQFEKETMLRDQDEELRKFIESGLGGSGRKADPSSAHQPQQTEILMRAAAKIKAYKSPAEKELLSNQMLAGIPEIDLGINARMTNIVMTEQTKKELLEKAMRKAAGIPEPVKEEPIDKKKRRRMDHGRGGGGAGR